MTFKVSFYGRLLVSAMSGERFSPSSLPRTCQIDAELRAVEQRYLLHDTRSSESLNFQRRIHEKRDSKWVEELARAFTNTASVDVSRHTAAFNPKSFDESNTREVWKRSRETREIRENFTCGAAEHVQWVFVGNLIGWQPSLCQSEQRLCWWANGIDYS